MFQVMVEHVDTLPENGIIKLSVPQLGGEIRVTPAQAKRRVKGYLTAYVAMSFRPGNPVLVWSEQPRWRMKIYLHLRTYGQVALLGEMDVDALTGEVIQLSTKEITQMQERANELAARFAPSTNSAG